jgi:hypothetical protein
MNRSASGSTLVAMGDKATAKSCTARVAVVQYNSPVLARERHTHTSRTSANEVVVVVGQETTVGRNRDAGVANNC